MKNLKYGENKKQKLKEYQKYINAEYKSAMKSYSKGLDYMRKNYGEFFKPYPKADK